MRGARGSGAGCWLTVLLESKVKGDQTGEVRLMFQAGQHEWKRLKTHCHMRAEIRSSVAKGEAGLMLQSGQRQWNSLKTRNLIPGSSQMSGGLVFRQQPQISWSIKYNLQIKTGFTNQHSTLTLHRSYQLTCTLLFTILSKLLSFFFSLPPSVCWSNLWCNSLTTY